MKTKYIDHQAITDEVSILNETDAKELLQFYGKILQEPLAFKGSVRIQQAIAYVEALGKHLGIKVGYDVPDNKPNTKAKTIAKTIAKENLDTCNKPKVNLI